MARIVFTGGDVFDGTGSLPKPGDVTVEDGRIVEHWFGMDTWRSPRRNRGRPTLRLRGEVLCR